MRARAKSALYVLLNMIQHLSTQFKEKIMRAIQFDTAGAAKDVLSEVSVEPTPPGPGEVLVKVAYASVNPTDVKRRGSGRELPNFSPIRQTGPTA